MMKKNNVSVAWLSFDCSGVFLYILASFMFIQLRVPIAKTNWIDREKKELWRQNWAIDITEISLVRTKKNMLLLKKDTFCTAIKKIDKKNFHHHKSTECL